MLTALKFNKGKAPFFNVALHDLCPSVATKNVIVIDLGKGMSRKKYLI
jgi:hypothetical protein